MAGDPHRGLDTPSVYYQNHIRSENFDVIGLSFPGCPGFPHFGHNEKVSWCVTHAGSDYQDLFIEKIRTNSGSLEYYNNKIWEKAEKKSHQIDVLNGHSIIVNFILKCLYHLNKIKNILNDQYKLVFLYRTFLLSRDNDHDVNQLKYLTQVLTLSET